MAETKTYAANETDETTPDLSTVSGVAAGAAVGPTGGCSRGNGWRCCGQECRKEIDEAKFYLSNHEEGGRKGQRDHEKGQFRGEESDGVCKENDNNQETTDGSKSPP